MHYCISNIIAIYCCPVKLFRAEHIALPVLSNPIFPNFTDNEKIAPQFHTQTQPKITHKAITPNICNEVHTQAIRDARRTNSEWKKTYSVEQKHESYKKNGSKSQRKPKDYAPFFCLFSAAVSLFPKRAEFIAAVYSLDLFSLESRNNNA